MQPIVLAAKPGDLCRRVRDGMRGRRRRIGAQRRPRIPPSAPITPVAKHRGCDAQLPCDLRQRPTAARQQGNRLPLELIRKLTTALAHWTPFPLPSELSKGVHQFGGGSVSAFPERVVGSACTSSLSRLARRSLALRPAHSRGYQFVTRYPNASAISSPP